MRNNFYEMSHIFQITMYDTLLLPLQQECHHLQAKWRITCILVKIPHVKFNIYIYTKAIMIIFGRDIVSYFGRDIVLYPC